MSKIYTRNSVLDASKARIRRIIEGFDTIVVSYSGGKDSEVTLGLVYEVAKEMNRLPINLLFLDQEAEYQATIDMVESHIDDEGITPHWLQFEFKLFNSTNKEDEWFKPWEAGKDWMRPKHPKSIQVNDLKTDRFGDIFTKYLLKKFEGTVANFGGVRAEESPSRMMALTTNPVWKDITFGKKITKDDEKVTFYPLYDWSYTDIWKYIFDNGLKYNRIYDLQYQYGHNPKEMRVSSFIHESSLKSINSLKEFEPETWDKITKRIEGVNTQKKAGMDTGCPKKLPYMFES
ncbi:MAG: phosphoadenosine phosphosulfate reductase family protein, partial [Bacteroidales bacterium]|nr:phosphoadenosine phosphosulfate reductase family protein [Bacteroidales bacterium]